MVPVARSSPPRFASSPPGNPLDGFEAAFTLACIHPALLNSDQLPSCGIDGEKYMAGRRGAGRTLSIFRVFLCYSAEIAGEDF
jgi:hypothetical protein